MFDIISLHGGISLRGSVADQLRLAADLKRSCVRASKPVFVAFCAGLRDNFWLDGRRQQYCKTVYGVDTSKVWILVQYGATEA